MATEKHLEQLADLAPQITATPIDRLVSNPGQWGTLNFEAARTDLEQIFGLTHELANLPFEILPDPVASQILQYLVEANNAVGQIVAFDIVKAGTPGPVRDQIVAVVKNAATNLLSSSASWIPFLAYQKGDVQKNIEEMARAADQMRVIGAKAQETAEATRGELDKIVAAAREASATAGVGVFTADFTEQANSLDRDAETWLKITSWAAGITLAVAIVSMFIHVGDTPSEIAQFLTSKVLALVVLISATVWCGRIYKATMHQAATNRHRAHALKTFQAFTQASDDEGTRNAVLLEATRSIFAISPSGYLETTEQAADSGTKVLEIIKGINGKG